MKAVSSHAVPLKADTVLKFINVQKHKVWLIGEVVKGKGEARVE